MDAVWTQTKTDQIHQVGPAPEEEILINQIRYYW